MDLTRRKADGGAGDAPGDERAVASEEPSNRVERSETEAQLRTAHEALRRSLHEEREKALNLTDATIGAKAALVQAKRDNADLFDRLHYVSTELERLKGLLGYTAETPVAAIEQELERPWVGAPKIAAHLATKGAKRAKLAARSHLNRLSDPS